jgi:hypothetical protein
MDVNDNACFLIQRVRSQVFREQARSYKKTNQFFGVF